MGEIRAPLRGAFAGFLCGAAFSWAETWPPAPARRKRVNVPETISLQASLKAARPILRQPGERAWNSAKSVGAAGLNPRDALDILEVRAQETEAYLVQHADVGDGVLECLAGHGAPATRQAVAASTATPAAVNRMLADDAETEVRAELAAKIARLMPGLEEREAAATVALTIETLECLARDSSTKVRAILAEEIKHLDCVPHAVAMTLARDLESIVAAPILEYSPLLSDADLMEIIACGQVKDVLAAIARRKPLNENVSDELVQSLDVPAVAALLVNPDAKLRKKTMERIVEQAEEIEAWHLPLALRADLSTRALKRISGFVGAYLIERLAARADLSDAVRTHLHKKLRAKLEERPGAHDGITADAAKAAVADAKAKGLLDDMFVEDAALAGHREMVIFALAALGHAPEATVRKIMGSGRAKPLVALVWHAHLSMRIAFKIQSFVMKLPAGELLPARGGIYFPLTADEMRWHLNYFDIPA